jgi:site-specific DNA-methyltransferase (adenine-specific)
VVCVTTTWHRRPKREPEDATLALIPREKPDGWTSDQWATPWSLIRELEQRFGPFDLDPAAQEHTAKAPAFYTIEQDGLTQPSGRVFCNPPYSKPGPWCDRARQATSTGEAESVVMLLPASVDTGWFHDLVLPFADVQFVRGRVRFIGWEGTPIGSPKAPSILAVYRRAEEVAA